MRHALAVCAVFILTAASVAAQPAPPLLSATVNDFAGVIDEASERAMQLRVLVSAADATRQWDLRCRVREALIDYIQRDYPEYLPRIRTESGGKYSGGDGLA